MTPSHHPPVLGYQGLTIVLGKPSRFDHDEGRLISARSGDWFNRILTPFNRHQCDIWTAEAFPGPRPDTKLTLLLGQEALSKYRTGDIRTYRGTTIAHGGHLYLPTFAPQEAYDRKDYEGGNDDPDDEGESKDFQTTRRKNFKFWLHRDTLKAIRLIQGGLRSYPKVDYKIYRPTTEVCQLLTNAHNAILVVDIETDKNLNLTCFGFTFYHDKLETLTTYVVPVKRWDNTLAYSELDLARIFYALSIAFKNNLVIGHNLAFDLFVLACKYKIPFPHRVFCTMIAHHRLHMEVEKSLGHIVSLYTDLPFHKDEGIFDPKTPAQEEQLWMYNAKDVATTLFAYLGMLPELTQAKALDSAAQGCASIRPYLTMQYEGMRLDIPRLLSMIEDFDLRYSQMERILSLLVGFNLNPRSPTQVSKYLYERLKLPRPASDLTSEENLHKLFIRSGAPSIRVILAMREIGTLRSKLTKTLLWREQRLTCAYKITGSDMHRLGSSALLGFKPFKGYGTNCQNYSKKLRSIVIPDDGMILGQTDQSGADAKIVAYLCHNDKFRMLFTCGIKPHTYVAMQIVPEYWAAQLGIASLDDYIYSPIDKLRSLPHWNDLAKLIAASDDAADPQYRYYYIAKQMCHSLNYDAGWGMFQLLALKKSDGALRLSNEACQKYHNLYRNQIFTEISAWHAEVRDTCERQGRVLRNLFGYPRQFGGFWGTELFKQLYAFIPQSTVACITHLAITEIQARIDNFDPLFMDVSLLQNGHDSILWQCPKDKWEPVAKEIKGHMERDLTNFRGEKFTMGSGTSIGGNWAPYDEKKNPNGLKEIKL